MRFWVFQPVQHADSLSNQKSVTAQTPPTFLAHGNADNVVPIENSSMFDSAYRAFHVPNTFVVDPGKAHGYGMDGIWPGALKNWMLNPGLLPEVRVHAKQMRQSKEIVQERMSPRYSVIKGIYLPKTTVYPDRIQIFTIDDICQISRAGSAAGNFTWKPKTAGTYLVRLRIGDALSISKVICPN